ncbi:hypothetical protein [Helicobacter sp.]|uniref:hypothetical protein n=1 Tax=Helicobacter sp. TaxID=218 RepID=UPI0025BACFEA|nr:hypothetical protein [Helicobacter sp.]MCI5968710.1 hypothetical protein [Helicobacter sp.]MDY2584533.1 hypothetical protein [Helicobacter sp.]
MKNVSEVLTHLLSSPNFKRLHEIRESECFIQLLSFSLKSGIAFSFTRDETLFIALKHSCFKQEFYHKIALVKQLLKQYQQEKNALLEIKDIKVFVTYDIYKKEVEKNQENTIPLTYGELSLGEFENLATNPKIHALFESIRNHILNNQE